MTALRAERLKQGLSLEWVAGRVGVTLQSIAEFETGQTPPAPGTLRKWVKALQLPDEWADEWEDAREIARIDKMLQKRGITDAGAREHVERAVQSVFDQHRRRRRT